MKQKLTILILLSTLAASCGKFGLYTHNTTEVVAKVGDKELLISDISHIFHDDMTTQDSLQILESYVNNWVKSEIKISAAQTALSEDEKELEELVEKYRSALITYRYENNIVGQQLDTIITQPQIEEYYTQNRDNFRLAGPIVKAAIVRLPSKVSNRKIEDMFKKNSQKDWEEFQEICQRNNYRLDDYTTDWTDFNSVIGHIPFTNSNFDEFLQSKKFYEVEDDQYKYMLKIESYRPTGDYSPIEHETNNIRKILLNIRRAELIRNLEDSLMKQALDEKTIQINTGQQQ